ncbi:hypothetical protein NQ317_013956 [Molorchus minor]|uniref:Uncharacterized protein n=1 Tax=Molorchus minor TaxID=1323400 RepID=A0ABQ9JV32_9CUCU|nr:hypothetical protein NQ317_013956 [Molorchus minor]
MEVTAKYNTQMQIQIIAYLKAGPEQFLTYITIASYTGQGQRPRRCCNFAVVVVLSFSLQFGIEEIGPKRPVLEKTCKSDVKNCEISCGSGRDVRT